MASCDDGRLATHACVQGVGKEGGEEFSQAELQGMLRRADSDADGDVDFYELLQVRS